MSIQTLINEHSEVLIIIFFFILLSLIRKFFQSPIPKPDQNKIAQNLLNEYLNASLDGPEIGLEYERYIGFLYERKGFKVEYFGALNGFNDMGRDLIVRGDDKVLIVQAKCWAAFKKITENHIFQLYGTAKHFKETEVDGNVEVLPVFFSSAKFTKTARDVANTLGVELEAEKLERNYPRIKCAYNFKGIGQYYLPIDQDYDQIEVNPSLGGLYAENVSDAVKAGFNWVRNETS